MELMSPLCMGFLIRKLINVLFGLKKGNYTLMKQQIIDKKWEKLINDELDVNNACSNFTDAFLTIAKECIPTREVTIRPDDNMWFDSNCAGISKTR